MGTSQHEHIDAIDGARETLDALLTVKEVAAVLKVTPSWVYAHTRGRR